MPKPFFAELKGVEPSCSQFSGKMRTDSLKRFCPLFQTLYSHFEVFNEYTCNIFRTSEKMLRSYWF